MPQLWLMPALLLNPGKMWNAVLWIGAICWHVSGGLQLLLFHEENIIWWASKVYDDNGRNAVCVIFSNIKDQYLCENREKISSHQETFSGYFILAQGFISFGRTSFLWWNNTRRWREGAGIMKCTLQPDLEVSQPRGLHIIDPNQHIQAFYENKHWKVGD